MYKLHVKHPKIKSGQVAKHHSLEVYFLFDVVLNNEISPKIMLWSLD